VIRYRYNTQVQPPAPFLRVTLRNPADGSELRDVPGQVDPGADRTVLPAAWAETLHLPQMGSWPSGGWQEPFTRCRPMPCSYECTIFRLNR
jgi:hypothetical protein